MCRAPSKVTSGAAAISYPDKVGSAELAQAKV